MMNLLSSAVRLTTGFLNTQDDVSPGLSVAGTTPTANQYTGQLGALLVLSDEQAALSSYATTGTLRGGIYQYVRFKAGTTAANAKGNVLYWDDVSLYQVTCDAPAAAASIAGIGLMVNTKGNCGWIQVGGLAGVLFRSSITKTTPAVGDFVIAAASAAPAITADVLADATALLSTTMRLALGVAVEVPANSTVKLVHLRGMIWQP